MASCIAIGGRAASAQSLPEGRAYELVTPAEKAGGMVAFPAGGAFPEVQQASQQGIDQASPDGNTVAYYSFAAFADPRTGMVSSYRARRTSSGWVSDQWSPQTRLPHPVIGNGPALALGASSDLTTGFTTTADSFDPLEQRPDFNIDLYAFRPDGSVTWESRPNADVAVTSGSSAAYIANSADGSAVAFFEYEPTGPLVPEAASQLPDVTHLYVRRDGVTQLVDLRNDGTPVSSCSAALGSIVNSVGGTGTTGRGAISDDGDRIFFTAPNPGSRGNPDPSCSVMPRLYVRSSGGQTIEVSASQRGVADVAAAPTFLGATADGGIVWFISAEALTDDAAVNSNQKLYSYDVDARRLRLLTDANVSASQFGFSEDGSRLYVGVDGNSRIALIQPSGVTAVAAFPTYGTPEFGSQPLTRVSPDGRFLLIATRENLTSFDSHGFAELYRWDANTSGTVCISCNAGGAVPLGDARLGGDLSWGGLPTYPVIRNMTRDGRRIAFDTYDKLVPGDTNDAIDTYVWIDGQVHLISTGSGDLPNVLFDVSESGDDIFFGTAASLVPQDTDNGDYDIYDARVGGGFPYAGPPVLCNGDQCQGTPSTPPGAPSIGTDGLFSPAVPVEPAATITLGKVTPAAKRAFAAGKALKLSVRATGAGKATATAKAAIGGKRKTVASAGKSATKAGTVRLTLKLSQAARRQLARKGKLTVRITVSFTRAASHSARLVLSAPERSGR